MIAAIIRWILTNYAVSFFVLGLLLAVLAIAWRGRPITRKHIFESLLAYYCLSAVGLFYLYNFVMHVFFGEMAAKFIGWANSPFQAEVGFASLGFGLIGLLAFRPDYGLRLAAIVGSASFLWGAAGGHVYQMVVAHNFAPGNAGTIFWADLLVPAVGFVFLAGWRWSRPSASLASPAAPGPMAL